MKTSEITMGTLVRRKHILDERMQIVVVAKNVAIMNEIGVMHTATKDALMSGYVRTV